MSTPITATVNIDGYEATAVLRMPNIGESYISESGRVKVCLRSHRKTVALVLTPIPPKKPESPYVDTQVSESGLIDMGEVKAFVTDVVYWHPTRFIGYVYADGTVRGEPYRFQSAIDPVELPVAVRIKKESSK